MRHYILLTLVLGACDGGGVNPPLDKDDDTGTLPSVEANLVVSQDEVDFGMVGYQETVVGSITVSNTGTETLTIASILAEAPFTAFPTGSLTVSGGSSSVITVTLVATSYDSFDTKLVLLSDDIDTPSYEIRLLATTISDVDEDGYDLLDAGGDDCDDTDPDVNPGEFEIWYDDIDENCDGASDFDQDGDGWEDEVHNPDAATGGGDCQDTNTAFYPGASDIPYDNMDTNCDDANDWDADGDTYASLQYDRGSDCDDSDPTVSPVGNETLNAKDDDCDGDVDEKGSPQYAPYVYQFDNSTDATGYSVAVGDLDDDGYAEVIVGSPFGEAVSSTANAYGTVAVFAGGTTLAPSGTDVDDADWYIVGQATGDRIGSFVTVMGNYDGDRYNDLAIYGQTGGNNGVVYILPGEEATSNGDTTNAMATFSGNSNHYLGRGIVTSLDLDSDGLDELVAAYAEGTYNAIAIQYGGSNTDISLTEMDARYQTTGSEVAFYRNAPVGADLDGDGYEDLAVSDGTDDYGSFDGGVAWILWGGPEPYRTTGAASFDGVATLAIYGTTSSAYYAWCTQPGENWDDSVDDDAELWVFQPGTGLHVIEGRPREEWASLDPVTAASVTYTWHEDSTDAEQIRQVGDWTGDLVSEMLVFKEDATGEYGVSELFSSEVHSGVIEEYDGFIGALEGTDDYGNGDVGYGMAPLGADIDGDGDDDTVVGDPDYDGSAGEAYVLLNGRD